MVLVVMLGSRAVHRRAHAIMRQEVHSTITATLGQDGHNGRLFPL